jgi:hypothetical protein
MDIGECANIHDLALRADYEQASQTKDYGYEVDVSQISRVENISHLRVQLLLLFELLGHGTLDELHR